MEYPLRTSGLERRRLEAQAALWEEHTWRLLQPLVRPGATVADVGCGPGCVTRLLARLVGPRGHVHALDPIPQWVSRERLKILL